MARDTSIEAYHKIKENGMLSSRRWEAYEILFHHGPMTCGELFSKSDLVNLKGYRQNYVARLGELRDLGVVTEVGTKKCSITGMNVILWDVTSNLPKTPEKKENKVEMAIMKERKACAQIAFDNGNNKIANLILRREQRELF